MDFNYSDLYLIGPSHSNLSQIAFYAKRELGQAVLGPTVVGYNNRPRSFYNLAAAVSRVSF